MLTSIGLKNFKALAHLPRLDLSPVTVLSGPNSSGKSSLIQALLVLKQTLESPSSEDPIILNGSLVALGEYDDVRSFSAKGSSGIDISVAVNFPPTRNRYSSVMSRSARTSSAMRYARPRSRFSEEYRAGLTLQLELEKQPDSNNTQANQIVLRTTRLEIGSEGEESVAVLLATSAPDELKRLSANYDISSFQSSRSTERLYPARLTLRTQPSGGEVVACSLDHFLPYEIWSANPIQFLRSLLFSALTPDTPGTPEHRALALRTPPPLRALKFIQQRQIETIIPTPDETLDSYLSRVLGDSLGLLSAVNKYLQSNDTHRWAYSFDIAKKRPPLSPARSHNLLEARGPEEPDSSLEYDLDASALRLDTVASDFTSFFTNGLYYLGPLREEPRAFYRRLGSTDPRYVGQRGENTAFVLKYHGSRQVQYVEPPSADSKWDPRSAAVITKPLTHAVKAWLDYLGLAADLEVRDVGKIGLSIQARVHAGNKYSDLTNVGVGVSQALPLIVLGLATPAGSTLLVEQPELHLHPYVQSRLADFFFSLTAMGKQVIAETHSEHLIHRMRLYVARGTLSPDKDLAIYFFSNTGDSTGSRVRPIKLGQYGEIDEWPDGFFDETTKQLDDILKATLDRAEAEEEE